MHARAPARLSARPAVRTRARTHTQVGGGRGARRILWFAVRLSAPACECRASRARFVGHRVRRCELHRLALPPPRRLLRCRCRATAEACVVRPKRCAGQRCRRRAESHPPARPTYRYLPMLAPVHTCATLVHTHVGVEQVDEGNTVVRRYTNISSLVMASLIRSVIFRYNIVNSHVVSWTYLFERLADSLLAQPTLAPCAMLFRSRMPFADWLDHALKVYHAHMHARPQARKHTRTHPLHEPHHTALHRPATCCAAPRRTELAYTAPRLTTPHQTACT